MILTRAVVMRYGGPEVLRIMDEPLSSPRVGELRIRVEAAGVALADAMRREGLYPGSPVPPFTPGYDVVGVVDEVGDGVQGFLRGQRVAAFFDGVGGYASHVVATPDRTYPVPATVESSLAVACILNYVTAYQLLHRVAHVAAGHSILVHGASGGVGTAILELGRIAGLRMFGTASAGKHPVVARFGAVPIDYREQDFVEVLRRDIPEGVDAVFDPIGGPNWEHSLETLGAAGRFVGYGYTTVLEGAGTDAWTRDWTTFAQSGRERIHMYSATTLRKERPDWFREDLQQLMALLEDGKLAPIVSHRIPLQEVVRAHEVLRHREHVGKVVLTLD